MNTQYQKLIFWLLSFLAVIMTGIGGSAASHLISEVDSINSRVSIIESAMSGFSESRTNIVYRLGKIEDKLDLILSNEK